MSVTTQTVYGGVVITANFDTAADTIAALKELRAALEPAVETAGKVLAEVLVPPPAPAEQAASAPALASEQARRRGRPRRKPPVPVQTREPAVEQAAATLPEPSPAPEPAPPAPQPEPAPAPAPGSPAALTDLLAKYAEKFGTIKLFQHIRDAGGKRVRDLDPHGRAKLMAALEKEMAG